MERTPFAGLTQLDPAEPLSVDDYSFQNANPKIIDQLLRLAVQAHRHDAHAALADPTLDPALTLLATGGTIPADTTIYVGYTLLDADGGETVLNSSPQMVTTAAGLAAPDTAPLLTPDTAAGTLVAGTYEYAVTVTDGLGGESAIGPSASVVIPPGSATNEIVLSGFLDILTATGGTAWRLWRRVNGGQWNLMNGAGATDTITDDGSLCPNCNVSPPTNTGGTTNGTNRIQVTVPGGQPAEAVSFNIYASVDGTFGSPALLGNYPIADTGTVKEYTTLTLLDGAPPLVSRAFGGANKIDALTQIVNLNWLAPVATVLDLPSSGNVTGDIRLVLADMTLHGYNGSTWVPVGGSGGGGGASLTNPLETHIIWQKGTDNVVELWGSDQTIFNDDFTTDDSSAYTFSNTLAGSTEGAGMIAIAGGVLKTAGSNAYFKFFGPTGMKGDFELVIKYVQDLAQSDRLGVYVGPEAVSGVSYVLMELFPGANDITINSYLTGSPDLSAAQGGTWIPPNGGDTAWMRVTRVGADFTIEDWRTDPALGGTPNTSVTLTVVAGVNTDTAASPVFLRIGSATIGDADYDNLRASWADLRSLKVKITKADGTSITKKIMDETGVGEL